MPNRAQSHTQLAFPWFADARPALGARAASPDDAPALAAMNAHLIADERSRNPMGLPELEARMRRWLAEGWRATLFTDGEEVIGYALYQERRDAHAPERPEVYVRQFFIVPERRGQGLGRAAFALLAALLPQGARLTLDVLETNPRGRRFWEKLGFAPYCTLMEMTTDDRRPTADAG